MGHECLDDVVECELLSWSRSHIVDHIGDIEVFCLENFTQNFNKIYLNLIFKLKIKNQKSKTDCSCPFLKLSLN